MAFSTKPGDLLVDLAHQPVDATNGHAQGSTLLTPQQQQAIVNSWRYAIWCGRAKRRKRIN